MVYVLVMLLQGDHSTAVSELHSVRQQLAQVKEQYDKHLLEVQVGCC
jgi:hypothetical protein